MAFHRCPDCGAELNTAGQCTRCPYPLKHTPMPMQQQCVLGDYESAWRLEVEYARRLLRERDAARNFAARLWAATQALLGQRDECLQLADGFRDVCLHSVRNTVMAIEQRNEAQAEAERFLDQRNEARADVKHLRQRQAQVAAQARRAALEEAAGVCEKRAAINRDVVGWLERPRDVVIAGEITETLVRRARAEEAEHLARCIRTLLDADAPTPEADNG